MITTHFPSYPPNGLFRYFKRAGGHFVVAIIYSLAGFTSNSSAEASRMHAKPDFSFPRSISEVTPGQIYYTIQNYNPVSYNKLIHWDIDHITGDEDMNGNSFITFAKSAIIYQRRQYTDFTPHFTLSEAYAKAAFVNSTILDVNQVKSRITAYKKIKIFLFNFSFEFDANFSFLSSFQSFLDQNVPPEAQSTWIENATIDGQLPTWISTVKSAKDDVRPNKRTCGGRTTNFYYELAENKTLHISYKLASFRNTPRFTLSRIMSGQETETKQALTNIDRL
ncbi:MAG: hypothetical protein OXT67_06040 [Zetaproteobacteria bacterium]|nr:hypothetical protein [Zetaproteobacteria bacterium]